MDAQADASPTQQTRATPADDSTADIYRQVFSDLRDHHLAEAREFMRKGHNAVMPGMDERLVPMLHDALGQTSRRLNAGLPPDVKDFQWQHNVLKALTSLIRGLSVDAIRQWLRDELNADRPMATRTWKKCAAQTLARQLNDTLRTLIQVLHALRTYACIKQPGGAREALLSALSTDLGNADTAALSEALARSSADDACSGRMRDLEAAMSNEVFVTLAEQAHQCRRAAKQAHQVARHLTVARQPDAQPFFARVAAFLLRLSRELSARITVVGADANGVGKDANGIGDDADRADVSDPGIGEGDSRPRPPGKRWDRLVATFKQPAQRSFGQAHFATLVGCLKAQQAYRSVVRVAGERLGAPRESTAADVAVRCVLWQWQQPVHQLQHAIAALQYKLKLFARIEQEYQSAVADAWPGRHTVAWRNTGTARADMPGGADAADRPEIDDNVRQWLLDRAEQLKPGVRQRRELQILVQLLEADVDAARKVITGIGTTQRDVEATLLAAMASTEAMMGEQHDPSLFKAFQQCVPDVAQALRRVAETLSKCIGATRSDRCDLTLAKEKAARAQFKAAALSEYLSAASSAVTQRPLDCRSTGSRLAVHWARLCTATHGADLPACNAAQLHAFMRQAGLLEGIFTAGDPEGYLLATRLAAEIDSMRSGCATCSMHPDQYVAMQKRTMEFILQWAQSRLMRCASRQFAKAAFDGALLTLSLGNAVLVKAGLKLACAAISIPFKVNTLNKYVMPGEDIDYESVFRLLEQQLNRLGFRLITTPAPWAAKVAAGAVVTAAGRYYNNRLAAQESSVSVIYEIVAENRRSEHMALDWRRGLLPTVATDNALVTAGMFHRRAQRTGAYSQDDCAAPPGGPAARAMPGVPSANVAEAAMQDDLASTGRRKRRHAVAPDTVRENYVAVQDIWQMTKAQSEKLYAESVRKLLDAASGDQALPTAVRARALRAAGGEASLVPVTLTGSHIPLINVFFMPDAPGSRTGLLFSLSRARPRWRYLSEKSDFPPSYFKNIGGVQFYVQTVEGQPSYVQGAVTEHADVRAMRIVNRKMARELLRRGHWRFDDLNMKRRDVQDLHALSATLSASSRFYKYGNKIGFLSDYTSCAPDRLIGKLHRESDIEHLAQRGASDSFLVRLLDDSTHSYQGGPCFGGPEMAENQTFVQSAADARNGILNASALRQVVTAFNAVYDRKITLYDVFKGRFLDGVATRGDVAEMSGSGANVYDIFSNHGEAHLASRNMVSREDGKWDVKEDVVPNAVFEKLPETVRRSAYIRGIDRRLHAIAISPLAPSRLRQSAMAALNGKPCLFAVTVGGAKLADIFFIANKDRPATGWLINLNSPSDLFVFIQEKRDVPPDYFDNVTGHRLCQDSLPGVSYREMGQYEAVKNFRAVNPVSRADVVLSLRGGSWNFDGFIKALQRTEPADINALAEEMVNRRRLHRYAKTVDFAAVNASTQDEANDPQLLKWVSDTLIEGQSVLTAIKGPDEYIGDWIRKRGLNPDRSVAVEITVGAGPRKRTVTREYRFQDFISGKVLHELGKRITTSQFRYHLTDDEKSLTGMREQAQTDYDQYLTKLERSHSKTLDAYIMLSQIVHKLENESEGVAESDRLKKFFRLANGVRSGDGVHAGVAAAFFARLRATLGEETYTSSELRRSHALNVLGELIGSASVLIPVGPRVGLLGIVMTFAVSKLQQENASAPAEKEMYRKLALRGLLYDITLFIPGVWQSAGRMTGRGVADRTPGLYGNPGTPPHFALATKGGVVPGTRSRPIAPILHAAPADGVKVAHYRLPSADKRQATNVSLDGLGLQRRGIYRNTYPLMSNGELKHFIKYDGRACEVFWDSSLSTLRIFDPAHPFRGGYHLPVRFERGQWQTHSGLGLQGGAKNDDVTALSAQYVTVRKQAPGTVGRYAYNRAPRIVKGVMIHGTWKGERGILPSFDASLRVRNVPVESLTPRQLIMQGPYAGAYLHESGRHLIIQDNFVFEIVSDPTNAALRLKDHSNGALGPEIMFDATGDGWTFARAAGHRPSQ